MRVEIDKPIIEKEVIMSSTLMWVPTVRQSGNDLPDDLKSILKDKYGLSSAAVIVRENDLDYLYGLHDAGIKGADELINAIETHTEVDLYLQY